MAMKKVEMEAHRAEYDALVARAKTARRQGQYKRAVEWAVETFDHIDGMMQFERKYENREFSSIESVDLVLEVAPLIFDLQAIRAVESLLKGQRRIDRDARDELADRLDRAVGRMWDARRLWDHLERNSGARQDQLGTELGGDQGQWRAVAQAWDEMGVVVRRPEGNSYRLTMATRMAEPVAGKCFSCGKIATAAKVTFLDEFACAACGSVAGFVILSETVTVDQRA